MSYTIGKEGDSPNVSVIPLMNAFYERTTYSVFEYHLGCGARLKIAPLDKPIVRRRARGDDTIRERCARFLEFVDAYA